MEEWEQTTLADVSAEVSYGYTESATCEKVGPRFLRITDIQNGVVNWADVPFCPISPENHQKYRLLQGDIVVARTGNSTGENYLYQGTQDVVFASYLIRFRIDLKKANPQFVWYHLRTQSWWNFIDNSKTGSAQAGANAKVLGLFPLRLPPLPEQHAIAHILGTLDDKIELNQRMNETLEAMARALFKSWFVDFEPVRAKAEGRDTGLPKEIADLFPDSFEDSELGEVPKGWSVGKVGDLADISSGKRPDVRTPHPTAEASVPLWGGNGPMAFVSQPLFSEPILLTGRVGTLGSVFRITSPCWPSDNTLILRTYFKPAFEYLFLKLQDIDFLSLNRGSTQPLLTQSDLKSQPVLLPKSAILEKFSYIISSVYTRIDLNKQQSRTLAAQRDTLLPKLLSGELQISTMEAQIC